MKTSKATWMLLLLAGLFTFTACEEGGSEGQASDQTEADAPAAPITLTKLTGSPAFADASLSLNAATPGDSGEYTFEFEVNGYELGVQTEPKPATPLANSGKGQHIHLIVDNAPYEAHYAPTATTDKLSEPGRHVVLAFLSRSYHESVKNLGENPSFVLEQYHVGEGESEAVDFTAPHMFYSRPKGTYSGADTEHLLLDFFLLNTDLSADGNKVRATIEGEEFILDEWAPYVIEGLPKGEITIKLELIDANGEVVPGPYNSVTRTVMLEE